MTQRMVEDIYRETGGFGVREYFGEALLLESEKDLK